MRFFLVRITLSLPESIMETCNVVLTFESVDEIRWCDHPYEISFTVLSHGTICLAGFEKQKILIFLEFYFGHCWEWKGRRNHCSARLNHKSLSVPWGSLIPTSGRDTPLSIQISEISPGLLPRRGEALTGWCITSRKGSPSIVGRYPKFPVCMRNGTILTPRKSETLSLCLLWLLLPRDQFQSEFVYHWQVLNVISWQHLTFCAYFNWTSQCLVDDC